MARPDGTKLQPLTLQLPDEEGLHLLARAFDRDGLIYYLEEHRNGAREPHLICRPDAWDTIGLVLRCAFGAGRRGRAPGSRSKDYQATIAWETTRTRNVYALLRAIGPHLSNDYRIAYYLKGLEALWPILAEENGGTYR